MSDNKRKSKHTPGPWTIEGTGILNDPRNGASVGTTRIGTGGYGEIELIDGTNEPDYNARLIAAAPELYDAARAVLDAWRGGDLAAAVRGLQSAVDKAEGKE